MKTTIQNTFLGLFTLIGVYTILSGFTRKNTYEQSPIHGTPERHVWEVYMSTNVNSRSNYLLNKETGELYLLSSDEITKLK